MESEGSLPFSHKSVTDPYSEPDDPVHTFPPCFSKIDMDI